MDMTITGGQVVIHENRPNGDEPTLRGSVNTAGEVLALRQSDSTVGTEPYLERLSGNVIKEHRCFPQALTPPAPLTITNGVVRSPANSGGRERQLVKWMHR